MANIITLSRFILIALFVFFALTSNNIAALLVFLAAAATDWLDGFIARRTHVSEFGRIADPVADRLLVIVTATIVWVKQLAPFMPIIILITREFIVTLMVGLVQVRGLRVEVIKPGKYATAAVILSFVLILLRIPYSWIMLYAAGVLYLVVGGIYVYEAIILLTRGVK